MGNQNQGKDILRIEVNEYEKFVGTVESYHTTTLGLAKQINNLFSPLFKDYVGCTITVIPNTLQLDTKLYFSPTKVNHDAEYFAFAKIGEERAATTSLKDLRSGISKRLNSTETFEITQEASELLFEFFNEYDFNNSLRPIPESYRRCKVTQEVTDNPRTSSMYVSTIYNVVSLIDIGRIVAKIYGKKNDTEQKLDYMIQPIKPINTANGAAGLNWILSVARLNVNVLNKLASDVGYISQDGSIPIISAIK